MSTGRDFRACCLTGVGAVLSDSVSSSVLTTERGVLLTLRGAGRVLAVSLVSPDRGFFAVSRETVVVDLRASVSRETSIGGVGQSPLDAEELEPGSGFSANGEAPAPGDPSACATSSVVGLPEMRAPRPRPNPRRFSAIICPLNVANPPLLASIAQSRVYWQQMGSTSSNYPRSAISAAASRYDRAPVELGS